MSTIASVVRSGLACPLGLRARTALATMKAGLNVFELVDTHPDATASQLSRLDERAPRRQRMQTLVGHALDDLFEGAPDGPFPGSVPVFVSLPSPAFAGDYGVDELIHGICQAITTRSGARVELEREWIAWSGRAGVFESLARAAKYLESRNSSFALVGGVDSLVDPGSLRALSARGWLLDTRNADGRVPGEAASFVLLAAPGLPQWRPRADLVAVELEHDRACFASYFEGHSRNRGDGLGRGFAALRRRVPERCDVVVSAQPSESYWGREFSHAYVRNAALMPEPLRFVSVADELGDLGAAAGGVALERGSDSFWPRWWERTVCSRALAYCVSDAGEIGAAVLARPS